MLIIVSYGRAICVKLLYLYQIYYKLCTKHIVVNYNSVINKIQMSELEITNVHLLLRK